MNVKGKNSVKNLVLLLIAALVGVLLFKPAFEEYSSANLLAKETEEKLVVAQKKVEDIRNGGANLGSISEVEKLLLDKKIPSVLNQPELITKLTGFAENADLSLNSINFSNPQASKNQLSRATINANLTGGFDGLLKFLKAMEDSDRKFVTKNITIQKGQTQGVLRVNFSLTIEVFYLPV